MTEEHKTKQEIIDEMDQHVPDELHPLLQYFVDNLKKIVAGISAIILVVAVYAGVQAYNNHNLEKNVEKLGAILLNEKGAQKIEALKALAKDCPSAMREGVRLQLATALMLNKQYLEAESIYKELEGVDDKNMSTIVSLSLVRTYMDQNQSDKALDELKKLKASAPESYRPVVSMQLANAAEQAQDWPTALESYKSLAEKAQPGVADYYKYKIKQIEAKI